MKYVYGLKKASIVAMLAVAGLLPVSCDNAKEKEQETLKKELEAQKKETEKQKKAAEQNRLCYVTDSVFFKKFGKPMTAIVAKRDSVENELKDLKSKETQYDLYINEIVDVYQKYNAEYKSKIKALIDESKAERIEKNDFIDAWTFERFKGVQVGELINYYVLNCRRNCMSQVLWCPEYVVDNPELNGKCEQVAFDCVNAMEREWKKVSTRFAAFYPKAGKDVYLKRLSSKTEREMIELLIESDFGSKTWWGDKTLMRYFDSEILVNNSALDMKQKLRDAAKNNAREDRNLVFDFTYFVDVGADDKKAWANFYEPDAKYKLEMLSGADMFYAEQQVFLGETAMRIIKTKNGKTSSLLLRDSRASVAQTGRGTDGECQNNGMGDCFELSQLIKFSPTKPNDQNGECAKKIKDAENKLGQINKEIGEAYSLVEKVIAKEKTEKVL